MEDNVYKRLVHFLIFYILLITLCGFSPSNIVSKKIGLAAIVIKVVQDVKHKYKDTDWIKTKTNTTLESKDFIKTGEKSIAVLKFLDNSTLRIRENTIVQVFADKRERGLIKNTKIDVGKMRFDVEKQREEDEFIITTPTAVATIRGTSGLVEVLEDGSTFLYVDEGSVNVRSLLGARESGTVNAGFYSSISTDGRFNISTATSTQSNEFKNALRTNEKFLRIQTNQGTFRIYYLDFEE